jgi:hypothetical protein
VADTGQRGIHVHELSSRRVLCNGIDGELITISKNPSGFDDTIKLGIPAIPEMERPPFGLSADDHNNRFLLIASNRS